MGDKQRADALLRATKMAILFKSGVYEDIIDEAGKPNPPEKYEPKGKFAAACASVGLTDEEKDWLWNYLRHMNEKPPSGKKGKWESDKVRDADKWASTMW